MGFWSTLLGILGFGLIGLPTGLVLGFFLFIYSNPIKVKEPDPRPLQELGSNKILDLLPDIPIWVKSPDYERVDWLNKFVKDMWPYLDKAICASIRTMTQPLSAEYIRKFQIQSIEFENLSLGTLHPVIQGVKVSETNESELVLEPAIKWVGNPDITVVIKLLSLQISIQLVDLQISALPRITLKPLVPTFPCFRNVVISLLEKPHVDFGLSVLGGDLMAIPGVYHYVQETIKKQVANLYLWPESLHIPILDASTLAVKKPVGILHVNVKRAEKLLKMDILGTSDPYVKLSLTGEKLQAKKTTVKKRNLNPEWNEKFKLIVKDPQTQVLELKVYDWDKVGGHDHLGMQLVPLKQLSPHETKELKLELLKQSLLNDSNDKKQRGTLVIDLTYVPFREDGSFKVDGGSDGYERMESGIGRPKDNEVHSGTGVLSVAIIGAEDVEGEHQANPYALVLFRGEKRKTKTKRKNRDPLWNEEFEFMLEEPPLHDKVRIEIRSKPRRISFRSKESLGHVEINLGDVVHNGRINEKYHLINSRNGKVHVELRWKTV